VLLPSPFGSAQAGVGLRDVEGAVPYDANIDNTYLFLQKLLVLINKIPFFISFLRSFFSKKRPKVPCKKLPQKTPTTQDLPCKQKRFSVFAENLLIL